MTARRYAALLGIAFLTPPVIIYGGLAVIVCSDRLSEWFGRGMFRMPEYVAEDDSDE